LRFKKCSPYYIKFLDHIKGANKPLVCQILVWIIEDNSDHIVACWWLPEDDDADTVIDNRELITIVTSTILKKRKLTI
jgi:hypothetical protein